MPNQKQCSQILLKQFLNIQFLKQFAKFKAIPLKILNI